MVNKNTCMCLQGSRSNSTWSTSKPEDTWRNNDVIDPKETGGRERVTEGLDRAPVSSECSV